MTRSRKTPILTLAAIIAGLLPSAQAGASPGAPASVEQLRRSALRRVEATREAVATGHLAPALRAGAALAGVRPVLPTPSAITAPPGTPPSLLGPVADLLGALDAARTSAKAATHITLAEAHAAIGQADALRRHRFGQREPGRETRLQALRRRHENSIDRPVMYGGAIALAEAIDRNIPILLAHAASAPAPGNAACDVVDVAPALCIGGDGPNVYTADAWLQIDLGGSDVYGNAAGSANAVPAASVLIDLGGDDLYERDVPYNVPTQGSALLGIGMLVDVAGNDRYVARQAPIEAAESLLLTQAYAAFGVAVMADGGGNDSYEASSAGPQSAVRVKAQGYAEFGALSLVLNQGGSESYLVHGQPVATTSAGRLYTGGAVVGGQGFALLGGTAIFADDGGNDDAVVQALTSTVDPADPRIHTPRDATAQGSGYASIGGTSVVLSGPGANHTSVRAISSGNRAGWSQVDGIAQSSFGALAVVDDTGGNDTYALEGRSEAVQRLDADACACSAASAASTVTYVAGEATAEAGAVALLTDHAGNDRYNSIAATTAEAAIEEPRTEGAADLVSADATAGLAANASQAAGGLSGASFLLDAGGDDIYDSTASSRAHAAGSAPSSATEILPSSRSDEAYSTSQASAAVAGYSELRDQGGADLYRSTNISASTTEPDSGIGNDATYSSVQGSSTGGVPPYANETPAAAMLIDIDGGAADRFEATPADPTCAGTRGKDAWVDCGMGAAGGLNA